MTGVRTARADMYLENETCRKGLVNETHYGKEPIVLELDVSIADLCIYFLPLEPKDKWIKYQVENYQKEKYTQISIL